MAMNSWLRRAAARSSDHPWTFGAVVAAYREIEKCSAAGVAAQLQCTPETLMWISLCRRPGGDQFADQVRSIATRFRVPAEELAAIVRRVDAIGALRSREQPAEHLIAARDRRDDEGHDQ
jgi:hypothetical protein